MPDDPVTYAGISLVQWDESFRTGMAEYAATVFSYTMEDNLLMRIAFGNGGPFIDADGQRAPRYTHAVTLPPTVALDLAQKIIASYAKPTKVSED